MTEVIEHVREQREALAEAVRLLRPRGRLILTTPNALAQCRGGNASGAVAQHHPKMQRSRLTAWASTQSSLRPE
jgi:2-polyprenyl-3-methyl-5-hydroxy-6-metoxy-1,4-benzoquinol methylase